MYFAHKSVDFLLYQGGQLSYRQQKQHGNEDNFGFYTLTATCN
jgi:hypothetical protein